MGVFAYYRDDSSSLPYIIGAVVTFFIIAWIWGIIDSYIQKRVKEIADRTIAARKVEVDNHTSQRKEEIDQHQKEALYVISKKQEMLGKARTEFDSGYIVGRRWLARLISESESTFDNRLENHLRTKSHPALKAAEEVKRANQKKREAIAKLKFLEYQLAAYKEYFPVLEEYEDIILDEVAGFKRGDDIDDPDENIDRAYLYLSKEEYQELPPLGEESTST